MLITFEFRDESIGLSSSELAITLALGEAHWAACRSKIVVTGFLE